MTTRQDLKGVNQWDPFALIQELFDRFKINLGRHYVIGMSITMDEQLVTFYSRCSFLQYLPSKPDKYGLKIFCAADPVTNYLLTGVPYFHIVVAVEKKLWGVLETLPQTIFLSSQELEDWMLLKNLTLDGTLKQKMSATPISARETLEAVDSMFAFKRICTLLSVNLKRKKMCSCFRKRTTLPR
ncbi:PiggyBac transposable element-derived protein 4 [Plakobranchus ocellatus]|uniref:PiggyBac transposable element-derived protein 4 n=1 Tax=Plakobranchus ocellatus TaxID=259542 RepID=A0AAV4DST8_9GAST|nr:PiggyBac transposable element-derived protein 4 [Plakobranchus ocellatus]